MRMIKKLASIALAATMIVSAASFTASANKLQPGDVNVDGKVDVTDATLVQLYVSNDQKTVESFIEGKYDLDIANVKGYGVVDISDATRIQLMAVEEGRVIPDQPDPSKTYNINNIRDYVVGLNQPVKLADGTEKPLINFDNAATTPALKPVMDEVNEKLEMYGSIGRGFSQKSDYSTDLYNATRDKVLKFVNADPEKYTCFYVNNTTDGLNKLASALVKNNDDRVLTTRMEHHANDLSWRERCRVYYAEVDEKGRVDYTAIENMLVKVRPKYVSITAASNVTGYVTDVHRVAKLAHKYGAKIIVDGAQIVAHRQFSMMGLSPDENIDFLVFSAHKMYSPYGVVAVVGLTDVLYAHMP